MQTQQTRRLTSQAAIVFLTLFTAVLLPRAVADTGYANVVVRNYSQTEVVVRIHWGEAGTLGFEDITVPAKGTNPYGVAVTNKSADLETFSMPYELEVAGLPGDLVGNSYVGDEGGFVPWGGPNLSGSPSGAQGLVGDAVEDSTEVTFWDNGWTLQLSINEEYFQPGPTPDNEKTLWLVDDETLTADLFREGVDKIVYAANQKATASASGGMTKAEFQTTDTETVARLQLEAGLANPDLAAQESARNDARTAAEASVTQATPTFGTKTEVAGPAGGILSFTVPHVGMINLDPASNEMVMTFCNYVKLVTGWALLTAFAWWSWNEFGNVLKATVTAQQAHGNPIVGGTGAQGTALIAAGILCLIFVGIPAAFWALSTVDLTALETNPFSAGTGAVQTALYLTALVFPYQLALTLLAAAFVIRKGGLVMILGVNAAIKFVVP